MFSTTLCSEKPYYHSKISKSVINVKQGSLLLTFADAFAMGEVVDEFPRAQVSQDDASVGRDHLPPFAQVKTWAVGQVEVDAQGQAEIVDRRAPVDQKKKQKLQNKWSM